MSVYVPNRLSSVDINNTIHEIKHKCGTCVHGIWTKPQQMCHMCVRISFPVPQRRSALCGHMEGNRHVPAQKGVPLASKLQIPYLMRVSNSQFIYPSTNGALPTISSDIRLHLCLACVPIPASIHAITCVQCLCSSYVPHTHDGRVCLIWVAKHMTSAYVSLSRFLFLAMRLPYGRISTFIYPTQCPQCFS